MHLIRFFFLLIFLFSLELNLFSQSFGETDLEFLSSKIRNTYAGYKPKVKQIEFNKLLNDVKVSKSLDTFALFSKLTSYFEDHHLSLFQWIYKKDIDTVICNKNFQKFFKKNNLNNSFWIDEFNSTVIVLNKVNQNLTAGLLTPFIEAKKLPAGYIIESKKGIPPGYCIFKFYESKKGKILTDFNNINAGFRVFTHSHFKNKNIFITSSYMKWKRIYGYKKGLLDIKNETVLKPSISAIDSNTTLIKMPDFSVKFINVYDSLIKSNQFLISNSKNLIIDIRNNGGGVVNCFYSLIPYICSGPIRTTDASILCSDDVIEDAKKSRERYIKKKDTLAILRKDKSIIRMEEFRGSFMDVPVDSIKCTPKSNKIENVALIINHGCRSAAELMVLYLIQIDKVKMFGENTAGAVDYLNLLSYNLPESKYLLWVGTAKRNFTFKNPSYDLKGIKPDIPISDDEPEWIEFVKKYYESK